MAKISANGAYEIARIKVTSPSRVSYLWVMTSAGHILTRADGEVGDDYGVVIRGLCRHLRTREALIRIAQIRGFKASSAS